jgi:hypothetical protein
MTQPLTPDLVGIDRCYGCGQLFAFSPYTVPSIPIDPTTNLPPDLCTCREVALDMSTRGATAEQIGRVLRDCLARAVRRPVCPTCMNRRAEIIANPKGGPA